MKDVRIHEAARREANLATVWYAQRSILVARKFADDLLASFSSAAASPLRYPTYSHGARRVVLKRFPYFIVFFDWQDEVYIVAIAHAKRQPGYWKGRV